MIQTTRRSLSLSLLASAGSLAAGAGPAAAEAGYPRRRIRLLLPFAAGGGQDEFARRFVPLIGSGIGAVTFVDNRPGGNSVIATELEIRAAPDGYTLLQQTNSLTANPSMIKDLPFDTLKDLAPISLVARTPHVLVVRPDMPAHTFAEMVAYAKSKPDGLTYGTAGIGSTNHLGALMIAAATGIDISNIVYKGASEYALNLIAGRIDFVVAGSAQGSVLANGGKVRALAVTSAARLSNHPDVPTFKELGFDIELYSWTGYLAASRTPADVIGTLSSAMRAAARDPATTAKLPDHEMLGTTPEEFAEFLARDLKTTTDLLAKAKV